MMLLSYTVMSVYICRHMVVQIQNPSLEPEAIQLAEL